MLAARWLPASTISQSYAVHEAALFRYSQRGMLAARWDGDRATWLYDITRVRELFLHREAALPVPPAHDLGRIGETHLAGGTSTRRPAARGSRKPLRAAEPAGPSEPISSRRAAG